MVQKLFGLIILLICALNMLEIVFKLLQPDTVAKWFGLLLIALYCMLSIFVLKVFFKQSDNGGQ